MTITMTFTKPYLFAALILLSLPACIRVGSAQGIGPNTSLKTETINDPSLGGMKAFTVSIPSAWHFQGTVIASLVCSLSSPVFRAYSPDGITEIRLLPTFNWEVLKGPESGSQGLGARHECIYLDSTMTAAQFLDRYVRTLGSAHVLAAMSISAGYQRQLDELQSRMNAIPSKDPKMRVKATVDAAALRIETTNGTFTIEQRLRARVVCTLWPKPIAGKLGSCSARLDVLRAPKGQLDSLVSLVDSHNLTTAKNDDLWLNDVIAQINGNYKSHFDPYVPDRTAMHMLYRQAHDFRLIQEENLRDSGEPLEPAMGPRRPMMATLRPFNVTSDWADYALDPKPVTDDHGVVHWSGTMQTWSSSNGQRYQTDDPGANPNGVLTGRWIGKPQSGRNDQPQ
jgi:hypothetical protein